MDNDEDFAIGGSSVYFLSNCYIDNVTGCLFQKQPFDVLAAFESSNVELFSSIVELWSVFGDSIQIIQRGEVA